VLGVMRVRFSSSDVVEILFLGSIFFLQMDNKSVKIK
jgi:hypothetical protein